MRRVPLLWGRVVVRTVSYKSEVKERDIEVDEGDIRNLYDLVREGTPSETTGCVMGAHGRHTCPLCSCLAEKVSNVPTATHPTVEHIDLVVAMRILDHSGIAGRQCAADELVPLKRLRMMQYITQGCERPALHCSDEVYTTLDADMLPDPSEPEKAPTSLTSGVHAFVTLMEKGREEDARRVLVSLSSLPSSKLGVSLASALCWLEGCSKAADVAPWLKLPLEKLGDYGDDSPLSGLLLTVQSKQRLMFGQQLAKLPPSEAMRVLASRSLEADLPLWKDVCLRASEVDVPGMEGALDEVDTSYLLQVLAPACVGWERSPKLVSTVAASIASVFLLRLPAFEGSPISLDEERRIVEMLEYVQSVSRPIQQDVATPLYPVDAARGFLTDAPTPPEASVTVKDAALHVPISDTIMASCREVVTGILLRKLLRGQRLHLAKASGRDTHVLRRLCRDRSPMASSHSNILNRIATCIALDDVSELAAILSTDLSPNRMLPSNSIAILRKQISLCPADSACYGPMLGALAHRLVPVSAPRSMWDDMWTYIMVLDAERSAGKLSDKEYRSHAQDIFCQLLLSAFMSLLSIRTVLMGILFLGYYSGKSTEGWLIRRSIKNEHITEDIDEETHERVFESSSDGPREFVVTSTLFDSNPNSLLRDLSMQLRYSLPSILSACFFLYPIYSPSVQKYVVKSVCDRADTTVMLNLAPGVQLDSYSCDRMVELFGPRCKVVITAKRPPPPPPEPESTTVVGKRDSRLRRIVAWLLDHI